MPVDIRELLNDSCELAIVWHNARADTSYTVNVAYKPLWYTWANREEADKPIERDAEGNPLPSAVAESNLRSLCLVLKSWDLQSDGQPIALTPEAIKSAGVPIRLIERILADVLTDMRPKSASEPSSSNGSNTAEPSASDSAKSPNGLPF